MFYDTFVKLCAEDDIKPSALLSKLGLSTGNLQKWKNGATVNSDILTAISKYFGVSLDYLVYGKENNPTIELTSSEQECLNKFNLLTDIDKGRILDRMETMHNAYAAGKPNAIFIAARNENDDKTISERREKGIVNPEILDTIPTMSEE